MTALHLEYRPDGEKWLVSLVVSPRHLGQNCLCKICLGQNICGVASAIYKILALWISINKLISDSISASITLILCCCFGKCWNFVALLRLWLLGFSLAGRFYGDIWYKLCWIITAVSCPSFTLVDEFTQVFSILK